MMRESFFGVLILLTVAVGASCYGGPGGTEATKSVHAVDSLPSHDDDQQAVVIDIPLPAEDAADRYSHLTDEDFRRVANELQVEVAAIKAVVAVEAGSEMKGFWAPGVPVVNHDRSLWNSCKSKVKSNKKAPADAKIPDGLSSAFAKKAWQKLINARKSNIQQADLSTFWGMFQIGGFNYQLCGCSSIEEFVELMSYSELEQLELFAALIVNCNMVQYLRSKNWAAFAKKYNGSSYARHGYHTKMANAYRKFKNNK